MGTFIKSIKSPEKPPTNKNLIPISESNGPIWLNFYRRIALAKKLLEPEFQGAISFGLATIARKPLKRGASIIDR